MHRPAGLSDEDSDSDDYGFYEKPIRKYYPAQQQENSKKKLEIKLQDAIIHGNVKEVEAVVNNDLNGNVNMKLESGWTPLMHASFHAQDKIVELLLEKGADPNIHCDSVTPIMVVCSNSSASEDTIDKIVSNLLDKGCILNIGDKYGQTPLMRAIGSGRAAVVQRLLNKKVNIEMRDQQGWTALFWAVHHNQPEILEILIAAGGRLTEVDKNNRTPKEIAYTHDHQNIIEILNKHLKIEDEEDAGKSYGLNNQILSWHEFYPGISDKGDKPKYTSEIHQLLYGMNCERLAPIIDNTGMDLRTFLLMQDEDMTRLGINLPYERQRLKYGLRKFHVRGWKLSSVAGLYARKNENYSVIDCLNTLGAHLQQIYILEATLQYCLREYSRVQDQLKFEPPDSPTVISMRNAAKKMLANINTIRKEIKTMKSLLKKINNSNAPPADLIKEKSVHEKAVAFASQLILMTSLGLLAYHTTNLFTSLLKK